MLKFFYSIFLLLSLSACQPDALIGVKANDTKTFITHDTIPETRDSVSKKPVATYTSLQGEKLEVNVYETKQMFQFIMKMKYKFLNEPDTLHIPNFGIRPQIVIKNGDDKQSCVVGFLDKKKEFKEYKLITVKTGNLQVKVLNHYFTGHYKTMVYDTVTTQ